MAQDRAWGLRLMIIAPLFMQLVFAFGAAKSEHTLSPTFPFLIQNARILCFAITLLTLIAIPFLNRYGIKDVKKLHEQRINPELVLLFLDMVMLLAPTTCVLILSFLSLPATDVYFYSYISFLVMLEWLFWKRHVFLPADVNNDTSRSSSPQIVAKSYTFTLCGLTSLAAFFLILKLFLMINPPP
jgi:hypothetical protein